jgi:hypothetical protein
METQHITDPKTWQALTDLMEAPLQQRWIYGAAAERIGRSVTRRAVFANEQPVALAQSVGRAIVGIETRLITRGPLLVQQDMAPDALKCLKRNSGSWLNIMTPDRSYKRLPLSQRPTICELDLHQDLEVMRAAQHTKWRNALKKAENSRLKVAQVTATATALMPLLRTEKNRQKSGAYKGLPPEFTLALQEVMPKALLLLEVCDAQMLFIRHGNSATYHMGYSGPEGRAANAHNLILWQAIKKLKALGVTRLDLGTIDAKRAPDLARFKRRSGAHTRRLGPAQLI